MKRPAIDAGEFDAVAATCRRWSDRSLAVAHALVVERKPLTETARDHDMTAQQANVIRTRFLERAERHRLDDFTSRERPARPSLATYSREIHELDAKGYSADQIVTYLAEHDVDSDASAIKAFVEQPGRAST